MKFNQLVFIVPAFFLFSCGAESTENLEGENTETENTETDGNETSSEKPANFDASFGECAGLNEITKTSAADGEDYSFSMGAILGVDLTTFGSVSAELTENHKTVRIKFVNDPAIANKGIMQFEEGQMSMTLSITSLTADLTAGAFTNDDLKINLTKGFKAEKTSKTAGIGSNKIKREIEINEISEDHICGSLTMKGEDGTVLVSAKFDTKVLMKPY